MTGVREMGAALKNVDIWKTSIQAESRTSQRGKRRGSYQSVLLVAASSVSGGHEVKANKLFRKFKEKGVWPVPTMVTYLNMAKTEIDPRSKFVPTAVQKQWAEVIRATPPEQTELMEAINSLTPGMVKKLNDAGVPMLAGTDSSYEMTNFIYGISLHEIDTT
ncbi:hypothetical protein [Paenibacillus pabuli]|uniref:hypothetical protein n=1 Tax=Paenibacillus pabuli TaxID=1472 RepID=UPI001FFF18C5|nr:hypothetical protein [Paenibacillus pabuli]UPK41538.1 hypothetical protein KET34_20020 [Paenibacillus pabuli]